VQSRNPSRRCLSSKSSSSRSDRSSRSANRGRVEIWIGGKLSVTQLEEIPIYGRYIDVYQNRWSKDPEELRGIAEDHDGLIQFIDQVGEAEKLDRLTAWLRENEIPFRMFVAGGEGLEPYVMESRPDLPRKPVKIWKATKCGDPLIPLKEAEDALKEIERVANADWSGRSEEELKAWRAAYQRLLQDFPRSFPPLPKFDVSA